ncbi:unnamed protein product [Paramecium sonneborni]|uniref:Uncharacterized protein n=1 Tax=Paramecium sonneborni TaxID=65129 RepID=A0A8S1M6T9_9CILI|nr:unnamed protein product [Paramecium sonneborni]
MMLSIKAKFLPNQKKFNYLEIILINSEFEYIKIKNINIFFEVLILAHEEPNLILMIFVEKLAIAVPSHIPQLSYQNVQLAHG